jgi:phosphoglycerate dehydrogenase-like enzyme
VTSDFAGSRELSSPELLTKLDGAGVPWETVDPVEDGSLSSSQLSRHAAFLTGNARVTGGAIEAANPPPLLLARFGVGTDVLDLGACTRHDVIVSITPDAIARPVAVTALTHILAATLNLHAKDSMVRDGIWTRERRRWLGHGLAGRTVGLIGLGNIASVLLELLAPLRVHVIARDPYRTSDEAASLGVELVDLDELLERSDVVVILCPLTPETYHLIGRRELARMKPTASLVNVARGPIVEHEALVTALETGAIASAGLDVFEREPLSADDRLTRLANVSLSPHGLSQTDQMLEDVAASAIRAILDVSRGRVPAFVANREVLTRPSLAARLSEIGRTAGD